MNESNQSRRSSSFIIISIDRHCVASSTESALVFSLSALCFCCCKSCGHSFKGRNNIGNLADFANANIMSKARSNQSPPFRGFSPHPTLSGRYKMLRIWSSASNDIRHIVIVQLFHAKKRNAINAQMWREIGDIFSGLQHLEEDIRAVILTGNSQAFTAGIDWTDTKLFPSYHRQHDVARQGLAFLPQIRDMQRCFTAVETCPIPVMAAMDGVCIGAGVDLACACDIRMCTANTVFSIREVKIGLAADIGTLQRLPKITGNDSLVRELCYTGEFFDATKALSMGLVGRVVSDGTALLQEAMTTAIQIVSNSPVAVAGTKQSLVYSRDHAVQEGLDHIANRNALALMTKDIPISVTAAQSKTTPAFDAMPAHSRL
jgi:delta(3,5)-delta(2,4)-dienoyl-CoA isomerase